MMYPLVLDLTADGIPVTVTCRVLGFSTQAFYAWRSNPISRRDWDDAHLANAAVDIQHDDPAFGYRFIADELAEQQGWAGGENRVARLCSQQRIWSVFATKRGCDRKAGQPVHGDLVDRKFTATKPNLIWLTDITEHQTGEGKLYLCAIKEVHSNRIVGYSIDSRMKAALAVAALRDRGAFGSGSQFRSHVYVRTLKNNGLLGSNGVNRPGFCGGFESTEGWSRAGTEEVSERVA